LLNFVQAGETVTVTAPYTTTSGQGVLVGSLFGVAANDISNGVAGEIITQGVVDIAKTSALAISAGDLLYWDDANRCVNKTATAQALVGVALAAAANPSATVRMRLNGAFQPAAS
jgi:predicted RecA/RadA family phage recombinase